MTPLQRRFVIEYCKDTEQPNATQAAIRAGAIKNSARQTATKWLSNTDIKSAIAERQAEIASAASISTEFVLRQWVQIATADPNEIIQLRKVCCRYCYGLDHQYQWTQGEYSQAVDRAVERKLPVPDGIGGFGYNQNLPPYVDCPECAGHGDEVIHINDTRHLTGAAKRLYGGVHRTKDGLKILMRDQDAALNNIARYLGMLSERKENGDTEANEKLVNALSELAGRLPS